MTIALSAAVMARYYGFSTALTKKQTRLQVLGILTAFALLAIPLSIALRQIAWETNAQRIARDEITDQFERPAQLDMVEIDFAAAPVAVSAVVFTPVLRPDAELAAERALAERLGEPVALELVQYEVGTSATAAERAQLSAAREREEAGASSRAQALALRLALAAATLCAFARPATRATGPRPTMPDSCPLA